MTETAPTNSKLVKTLKAITAVATATAALVGLIISVHTATATFRDTAAAAGTDQNKAAIEKIASDIEKNREEIRNLYQEVVVIARMRQPVTINVPRTLVGGNSTRGTRNLERTLERITERSSRPRLTPPEKLFKRKARELPRVEKPQLKSYQQLQQQQGL